MINLSIGSQKKERLNTLEARIRKHFGAVGLDKLISSQREFPVTVRADLQEALTGILATNYAGAELLGFQQWYSQSVPTFASLVTEQHHPAIIAPLQFDDLDTGELQPRRCLRNGLWLVRKDGMDIAILLTLEEQRYGRDTGIQLELTTLPGEPGVGISNGFFSLVEAALKDARSYRGKIISLEKCNDYSGRAGAVRVHRLESVSRDQVILPESTVALLDRNVQEFIQYRGQLKKLGMSAKKGLLFHGPPGTGKTHTIRYLASNLPDHTTFLIMAEQMVLLKDYVQMARFLQPAIVAIEDVDLIARDREEMRSACEESLLNQLLNEMDGLREDSEIIFVLTTNRPAHLEAALVARPGRIDQAIEFPLPDAAGRRKLIRLYARGAELDESVLEQVVGRTTGISGAFIKEFMRRAAQSALRRSQTTKIWAEDLVDAADEMAAGSFTSKILGSEAFTGLR